jgi:hypothetical protein
MLVLEGMSNGPTQKKKGEKTLAYLGLVWAYLVQRAPALCGVWGRVSVASITLACAMRGDRDSNPGPSGQAVRLYRLHQARPSYLGLVWYISNSPSCKHGQK